MPDIESPVPRTVAVVRAFDQRLDEVQRQKVLFWAQALLRIREGTGSPREKAIAAITATRRSGFIGDLLARIVRLAIDAGWKNRTWPARLGLGTAVVTLATVGNHAAGIAALGGAVGVPLWIVLGAGGTLAGTLVQELTRSHRDKGRQTDETTRSCSPPG